MQKRILVVEDDEMTNKVITNFLAEQNFTVFSALDGQAGWDIFQKGNSRFNYLRYYASQNRWFSVVGSI